MERDPDIAAVDRFRGGDEGAFVELMERYEDRIYSFLHRMCGCPEGAADTTQETFLAAFRSLKTFRGDALFRNWLYRVATNSCLRSKRKRTDEPDFEISLDEFLPDGGTPRVEVADTKIGPESEAMRKETTELVEGAVLELPKKYRLAIVLRDMEGLSAEEAARVLEISVPAVKSRLHRARLFVKNKIDKHFSTSEA